MEKLDVLGVTEVLFCVSRRKIEKRKEKKHKTWKGTYELHYTGGKKETGAVVLSVDSYTVSLQSKQFFLFYLGLYGLDTQTH